MDVTGNMHFQDGRIGKKGIVNFMVERSYRGATFY